MPGLTFHCTCVMTQISFQLPSGLMQVSKEVEEHGDIMLVREKTNYKSILLKTFFVLEYAIKHYDVRFILKTDDDAYVHVERSRAPAEAALHQPRLQVINLRS